MGNSRENGSPRIILQKIAEGIPDLPAEWGTPDGYFSQRKSLFDYQLEALQNARKILWFYYSEPGESQVRLASEYRRNGLYREPHLRLKNAADSFLADFYPLNDSRIAFRYLVNRMSFWMATGSGKTLVIIKLIEQLRRLMDQHLIPEKKILFLTCRKDLIGQFRDQLAEYNQWRNRESRVRLVSLKEYEDFRSDRSLGRQGFPVYFYRSDLLSDERKEHLLNFRDYLSDDGTAGEGGDWYLILDEAHKGDKQDSKRQHIFSVLAQKGFLFNFSATFTDPLDIVTTVYNLNLAEFIGNGYGKRVYLLRHELDAFRRKEAGPDARKSEAVLKSLLLLAGVKKCYDQINEAYPYHNPLMIALVNSVNVKNADLQLFFGEIARLALGGEPAEFGRIRAELADELAAGDYLIGDQADAARPELLAPLLRQLDWSELLRRVFHSPGGGNIEVLVNPANREEMALKLSGAARPFGLIKIGDIAAWLRDKLTGYTVIETLSDPRFFRHLNDPASPVNILLGSRAFYEGWDSNRPNVLNFVNIGTGAQARKFVLQAVGRGVRIEPLPRQRKRLGYLLAERPAAETLAAEQTPAVTGLESLFVSATRRQIVGTILSELEQVKRADGFEELPLRLNEAALGRMHPIPVFTASHEFLAEQDGAGSPELSREELRALRAYWRRLPAEVMIFRHELPPALYLRMDALLSAGDAAFRIRETGGAPNLERLMGRMVNFLRSPLWRFSGFEPLAGQILHYKKFRIRQELAVEFKKMADALRKGPSSSVVVQEFPAAGSGTRLMAMSAHLYQPLVVADGAGCEAFRNAALCGTAAAFVEELAGLADRLDARYPGWLFSRVNGRWDTAVYLPYFDSREGAIARFYPDFIFWLPSVDGQRVVLVNTAGTPPRGMADVANSYRQLFGAGAGAASAPEARVELLFYVEKFPDSVPAADRKLVVAKGNLADIF